jgi:hypothetical protein
VLQQVLHTRVKNMEKPAEVDFHLVEFDDVRYHIQVLLIANTCCLNLCQSELFRVTTLY